MKQLFLVIFMFFLSLSAYAQDPGMQTAAADTSRVMLHRRLAHLMMDKQKLTEQEKVWLLSNIDGADRNAEWDRYRNNRNTGTAVAIGGYSVAALSGAASFVYLFAGIFGGAFAAVLTGGDEEATQNATKEAFNTAGVFGVVALGSAVIGSAGLPIAIVNGRRMNKIVNDYNSATQYNTLPAPAQEQPALTLSLIPATRPAVPGQNGAFIGIGLGVNF